MNHMQMIVLMYMGVLGAAMGSFAAATAWRIAKGRSFTRERSECESCHHVLAAKDLVPVLSWLWLRGKCRYCKRSISSQLLGTELAGALIFMLSFWFWPYEFTTIGVVIFALWLLSLTMLMILFIYDAKHFILPDVLVWPLVIVGAGIGVLIGAYMGETVLETFWGLLFSLLPVSGVYLLLHLVSSGRWIGLGDVKLGVFMGFVLGWGGAFCALLLANLLGTIYILPLMAAKKLRRTDHVPFGPFLIAATVIVFLWGRQWFSQYLSAVGL